MSRFSLPMDENHRALLSDGVGQISQTAFKSKCRMTNRQTAAHVLLKVARIISIEILQNLLDDSH